MSEEILHNEDTEILKRKLEQLKQEYERTAERLQRAEHHDAIRRVSDQHRLTQMDSSQTSVASSAASSIQPSEYSENHQHMQLQSSSYGCSTAQKIPAIQLQLAEIASTLPLYSPTCKRSPAHRLRSKRSRLRLQNKERESDTDISQENVHEKESTKIKEGSEYPDKENSLKNKRNEVKREENHCEIKKELDTEMMPAQMKSNNLPIKVRKEVKKLPIISSEENELEIQNVDSSHEKVNELLSDQTVKEKIQSVSALSTQASLFSQSSGAVQLTDKPEVMSKQTNQSLTDTNKACDDRTDTKHSSSGILDSCTLVEGLPFPVEYYIRTTRRMAASHSSVDLDAVIYSQLTGGRGRRRFSQSQTSNRAPVTPQHSEGVCMSTGRGRGRGRRGRRGRRRSTVGRASSHKALDSTISHSASDSQAVLKSESYIESPSQSELVLEELQKEPIQLGTATASSKPSPEQRVTQDLTRLPDSQLRLDSQLLLDSNLYPLFRRKLGQCERESQMGANNDDQSTPLPSLALFTEALQEKDTKTGVLTSVDIQDFHLPDEDFGQLKLERLHLSTSVVEPFIQCPQVYNTRQSRRHQRKSETVSCKARDALGELSTPETMTTFSLEESLPLYQSDPAEQPQTEMQKDLNMVNLMDSRQLSKTEPVKCLNNKNTEALLYCKLPEKSSLSPVILELSPSLTSHTQKVLDPILPTLGMSPHVLTPGSPIQLRSPLFSSSGIIKSPSSVAFKGCLSPESVLAKTSGSIKSISPECATQTKAQGRFGSQTPNSQETLTKAQNNVKLDTSPQNNTALGYERLNSHETTTKQESLCISENVLELDCSFGRESSLQCENKICCTPENECQLFKIPELESPNTGVFESAAELNPKIQIQSRTEEEVQTDQCSRPGSETQSNVAMDVKLFNCGNQSGAVGQTPIETTASTNRRAERIQSDESNNNSSKNRTLLPEQNDTVLQEMHTFKALEGGCVLDLCLVRWASEDLCVCVAGEQIICLWAQMKGNQQWSLIHTWTFAQIVMSLQVIPDSSGLLCVTLGRLEITETRALCCPSIDGPFSQNVVCKDTLQALVGVSNCRLAYCTALRDQQRVGVLTLTQEGRIVSTLPLVSAKENIRYLAVVEGEKDALIGWTECQTLIIWNVKSGQLLQTIYMDNTLIMTNCMKGYSYKGVLCVLLQDARNMCDEESNTSLFTLIAVNPLTGKHITLTSINYPDQHKQQLIDGDVSGSVLVGVFQSGHLAVWDLRGSVAKVVCVSDELCRLARWAGPDTLLTGCLNGDVSVFHYKSS